MRNLELEIDQLQEKADRLERLYADLNDNLTTASSPTDYAVAELAYISFAETYEKIYALTDKLRRRNQYDPRTWFSKK